MHKKKNNKSKIIFEKSLSLINSILDLATASQVKEFIAFFAASVFKRICVSEELKSSNNNLVK